ncbi:MAG: 23S rRNA (guanosine(2251)-2'-O)-methyltransferase RlmB [Rikenellaceae bacterium]|jgi:23S rRNA (guanosine2251-2'-O)-methyltransferase|nr:23S rRNA (guanosine(2251)-2'-O)-methyltransferase RlmB [Rikenellaceae bacterium]
MENIVFGLRPVIEAIEAGRQIEKIYIKKGADGQLLGELREIARAQRIHIQDVPLEKLDRLVKRGANHQGVVAQISAIVYSDIEEILAAIPEGKAGLVVVFDGVTDVRNFGGIARTAECAGADGLIVPAKNAAPVNADALKASAGALNIIPVSRVGSVRNALKMLQTEGFQVVAATEKAGATLYEADFTVPTAIVMGSEETGISKEVLKLCDAQVAIPMRGKIGSLNVAAAAAVVLYEVVRQRVGKAKD